ncbi:uncharacterized protein LACBIDRAFT_318226 [Laccaria bicolor S238N-H82]|uniref:Predicted protein n=1 Tax=Laccaria bicolor (strain S238N-H82 / ATCC MYA-4686) TaxID=486041 RepID=B0D688_LACBS|nr:uncharacterized protein LACBIDRAFT_318226 [Laccaria bicolor S238N-H82]EDR09901.1 predicted protein [Laccaria bicolor S238N-H82]|eukprot:XP_001879286.1 predicted protein [Laccaria bicolor S238N-H82]
MGKLLQGVPHYDIKLCSSLQLAVNYYHFDFASELDGLARENVLQSSPQTLSFAWESLQK